MFVRMRNTIRSIINYYFYINKQKVKNNKTFKISENVIGYRFYFYGT